jgi:tRNA threonylcarbamoyladenosine biosynthesis protein TsaB
MIAGDRAVLAFDTTLGACSVALVRGDRIVADRTATIGRGHAEALIPMIGAVLEAASATYAEIALCGVTVGPGTFAGIRVGIAAARGIALVTGVRAVGVTTLAALAESARRAGSVAAGEAMLVAQDARRGEVYVQAFGTDGAPLGGPVLLPVDRALSRAAPGPGRIVGSAAERVHAAAGGGHPDLTVAVAPAAPDAAAVAVLAQRDLAAGTVLDPRPLYLRKPDARLPGMTRP